jgi:hypothetical protein
VIAVLIEWLMDRYRGRRGLRGWLVARADVRWLRRAVRIAARLRRENERGGPCRNA